jgi:hypothetical protein
MCHAMLGLGQECSLCIVEGKILAGCIARLQRMNQRLNAYAYPVPVTPEMMPAIPSVQ